ncbi:unnamed protein product [Durusdinium trenchii]|uniref:Translation elongation factor P/YeiP central domain-containing protein n=2 Tax=Durusdinium trenchii TaxID=1381693 RepID=A0ABP0JQL0_9DINO
MARDMPRGSSCLLRLVALLGGTCFVAPQLSGLQRQQSAITRHVVEVPGGLKNGVKMVMDDEPWMLMGHTSKKQGKGVAITKAKVKNMFTGAIVEKTLNSGTKFEEVETTWEVGTFTHKDEDDGTYHVMDMESFEDRTLEADVLGEMAEWLQEGQSVELEVWNDKIISMQFPDDIIMEVTDIKQSKDSGRDQIVTLENGVSKQAPSYIKVGDKVKVDKKNFEIKKRS